MKPLLRLQIEVAYSTKENKWKAIIARYEYSRFSLRNEMTHVISQEVPATRTRKDVQRILIKLTKEMLDVIYVDVTTRMGGSVDG